MPIGTVKWYDCMKGFGFILTESGEDVFAHYTDIVGDGYRRLYTDERVEYELIRGPKGLKATNVRHLDKGREMPTPRHRRPNEP